MRSEFALDRSFLVLQADGNVSHVEDPFEEDGVGANGTSFLEHAKTHTDVPERRGPRCRSTAFRPAENSTYSSTRIQ